MAQIPFYRRRWVLGSLLSLAFVVLLLARAPVAALGWVLPANLTLSQASGTLWQGQMSALGLEGVALQQNLSWQFEPRALLAGQLAWQIRGQAAASTNPAASQARLVLGAGGVALENVDITLPLEGALRAVPKIAGWGLGGTAQLRSARLSKQAGDSAELTLDPLFSQLVPALSPLTTLRANLVMNEGGAKWTISPLGSSAIAVQGQGALQWLAGGRVSSQGEINLQPDEKVKQQLAPLLLQIPATANGYQIKF
ncbi:type II secretion system protein N [Chitinibacter tainanensis]|uniref:type II secretion system protein N n=1 Tax=Chitinibacter tainanensis TaxID=230667 RepID=UPI002357CEEB|nr:type II secretion system protein N [Chitinibacter tainanensis]